jgi:hypothetical protein
MQSHTRGQAANKAGADRRLGRYEEILREHGDKEVVNSLEALMRAIVDRLGRKSRTTRGRHRA